MRYYLHLAYKGANYRGWQRQPNVISVQEVIEDSLAQLLKNKTVCIGCGRTDAGVHASQYILHFDVKNELQEIEFNEEERTYYLNSLQCVIDFSKCKQYYQDYFVLQPDVEMPELIKLKEGIDAYYGSGMEDLNYKNALVIGKFFENKHYSMVIKL